MLPSHLHLGLTSRLTAWYFPTRPLYSTILSPKPCNLLPTWLLNKIIVHSFKLWMNVHKEIRSHTHSMVQSPSWAANWFAASQEIPRISRNPKVHYRTHKRTPPLSILGQPNPIHLPTSHLLEIHPNIIHPSTPRSPHWSLSLRFPHQDPILEQLDTVSKQTNAHTCMKVYYTHTLYHMFRPLMWPSSGKCITKYRHIEIFQKFWCHSKE